MVLVLVLGDPVLVLALILGGQVLVLVLGGQVLVLVLVLGGQVLVNIPAYICVMTYITYRPYLNESSTLVHNREFTS